MNLKYQSLCYVKTILLPFLSAGIILFVLYLMVPQPVQAASLVVINSNDSGSGSLRWAIDQANATPGDDIITFDAGTDGNPIYLGGAAGDDANVSGDLDILDNGNLTILGNGAAITIIDGSGNDRVFHICPGGGCSNTVIMDGVTIRDGSTTSPGGGIWNYGTLNVLNTEINGSSGSTGGGIYNESGEVTLDGSMIYQNTSSGNGGGIYAKGTFTVQNHTIVDGNAADLNGGGSLTPPAPWSWITASSETTRLKTAGESSIGRTVS